MTSDKRMRAILLFLALALLPVFVGSTGDEKRIVLSEDLSVAEVEKDIFVVTHSFPWSSNSLVVRASKSDCVLVNTLCENHAAKLLVDWIKNNFGEVNLVAINTGFHVDNLGGNEFLLSKSIAVYGSDVTAKLITERGQAEKTQLLEGFKSPENKKYYDAYKNLNFVPPNRVFDINEGLQLRIGKEDVNVFYPGPSHTIDNVVVYFPKRKILFGGCMIKSLDSENLGYTADADMKGWPKAARKVLEKYSEARIVIPGHGNWGDIQLVKHTIQLLDKETSRMPRHAQ